MTVSARWHWTTRQTGAAWLLLAAALIGWPPAVSAQQGATAAAESQTTPPNSFCADCHDVGEHLSKSAHASVACAQCHVRHEEVPHPEGIPKPACANCHAQQAGDHARSEHGRQLRAGNDAAPNCDTCHGTAHELKPARTSEFRQAVPQTCGMCHSEVLEKFQTSVHGKAVAQGIPDAPVCTDCHGEHSIQRPDVETSNVNPSRIPETCGRCHGDVRLTRRFGLPSDRLTSFDQSFHGLASKSGSQTVANCASCHGVHDILPSTDPASKVNTANLAKTCGQCHPGAGGRFALGPIHVADQGVEPNPVRLARGFYLIIIPMTVGLMILHHGGDWFRKLRRARFAASTGTVAAIPVRRPAEERMYGWERVQHALLAISFGVLTWSGFALKYPDQWWARPLVVWEGYGAVRGTVHRFAGAVMISVALAHVLSLVLSGRLRRHWVTLFPRRRDVVEGFQNLAYNLGLTETKPRLSEHSYIEKVEYWAVIWGTFVMALTGVMLWANNLMLAWLPKSILDLAVTVHFYEAVLAALSILVWHLYSVIFDPDVYPMDTAWLSGRSPRRRESDHTHSVQPVETVSRSSSD